ncbi:single-stranded-DNA-specific exonuclease RecJ [Niallia sp. Krafla_26]|uniref:single-stranded-DNA-specific exonuclease RecJ n=1 Tax=Niallia sp. Krafla_26 TaxID=3064703 RepID=UPI003D17C359
MLKSKTRWIVRPSNHEKMSDLVEELGISPLVASLLVNRGLDDPAQARAFLFNENQEFHDPFLLNDMDKAVQRVQEAIANGELILIFGDYDADGVTSTTIMMKTLQELGANVQFYIPNRFTEGYGPNEGAFRYAHQIGVKLIITVDTGIAALQPALVAKELGIDLIITDHHEPGPELPEALAIIHPKLENGHYPFPELAGVGVAFKFSHALLGRVPEHLLQFAAIGTVADLVPLKDENRLIVQKGINELRKTQNAGVKALLKIAKVDLGQINEETIGFTLGPRINAVGRLESADPAVELLLEEDPDQADMLAEEIEQLNQDRKQLVNAITEEAIQLVEEHFPISENTCIIVGKEGWNSGVIGIVASKLVEKYYRPTIVLSYDLEKGLAKGSARSIEGFDLFKNLSTCRDLLPHFGGHTMAAGMTLKLTDVDDLRNRMNILANEQLKEEDLTPITYIDAEVNIEDISIEVVEEMNRLAPYGTDNPKPKVLIKDAPIDSIRKIGSEQNHLKLSLEQSGVTLDGVGFGLGPAFDHVSPHSNLSVIGELSINEWNNRRKPQIFLQDLSVLSWQLFDYRGGKKITPLAESLPREQTKWIIFQPDLYTRVKKSLTHSDVILLSSDEDALQLELDQCHVILVDFPTSKSRLVQLLAGKNVARIYAHFYKAQSDFFSTIPTRDHFKWFYAFLAKKGPFDLQKNSGALAKYRGWTKETIDFMTQVFLELEFVTMENGFVTLRKNANKHDLSDSSTYKQKQESLLLEKELLFSSYEQLKNWFDHVIHTTVQHEEEVKEWI